MVVLLVTGCTAMGTQSGVEPVRIAVDLELSGDNAPLGSVYRNALELRVEQVNQQGLLGGNRRLELEIRDNRSDPAVTANNLREFASDPSISAIVTGACAECLASAIDTVSAEGIPTISLAAPSTVVSSIGEHPSVFKLGPNAEHAATTLVSELRDADLGTVAFVGTNDAYGQEGRQEVERAAEGSRVSVVFERLLESAGAGAGSAAAEIASYQPEFDPAEAISPDGSSGPDAVIIWGLAPFGSDVAGNLRQAGYEGPIFLDPGAADNLFLAGTSNEALVGATMIFTETLVIDEVIATSPAKTRRKNWFNDYTARFGTYHAYSSFAADAIELLVFAMNRAPTLERGDLTAAVEGVEMDGLTGSIRMTPDNHSGLLPQALTALVARGDRWRLAG